MERLLSSRILLHKFCLQTTPNPHLFAFFPAAGQGNAERHSRWDVSGLSRSAELHDLLKAEVMLRRLKRDVMSQVVHPSVNVAKLLCGWIVQESCSASLGAQWPMWPMWAGASCRSRLQKPHDVHQCPPDQCACPPSSLPPPLLSWQLPPKRRQVIRLPKPPPSEWPKLPAGSKRGAAAAADSGSEVEEDEEGEEGEGEAGDGSGGPPKHMSSAHRTGLAKASAVIDWLTTALGVRGGRRGGGAAQAAADDEGGEDGAAGAGSSDAPKVLVFAHHKTVMNRLAAALEGATGYAPVGYVRIDGGTDPEDRRVWEGGREGRIGHGWGCRLGLRQVRRRQLTEVQPEVSLALPFTDPALPNRLQARRRAALCLRCRRAGGVAVGHRGRRGPRLQRRQRGGVCRWVWGLGL